VAGLSHNPSLLQGAANGWRTIACPGLRPCPGAHTGDPQTLLSAEQHISLFAIPTARVETAPHFVLNAAGLALVQARLRAANRLGLTFVDPDCPASALMRQLGLLRLSLSGHI
jgi:hypothetical protein